MSKKFVIVGAPRTGSTLLVKTLNNLEDVCCHGELLGAENVRGFEDGFDLLNASKSERDARSRRLLQERTADPVGFIDSAMTSRHAVTGFKALYSALLHPQWQEVVAFLQSLPDIRFIHLTRNNGLRRFISEQILQQGGANHSGAGGRSELHLQVRVDIDDFLRRSAQIEAEGMALAALLSQQAVLAISYEELSADTTATVARVCQFLGVDVVPSRITPALQKVGAADLKDAVSNYQELLEHPATRPLVLMD